jgi:Flp pilus assembly protein TadG
MQPATDDTPRAALKRHRGQSLTEFALALPIVAFIMLGTLDLGQMFFDYIQLRNAVREGASYGAKNPTDTDGIKLRVTRHGDDLSGTSITVTLSGAYDVVGGDATVTVQGVQSFAPLTFSFLSRFGVPSSFSLTSSSRAKVLT